MSLRLTLVIHSLDGGGAERTMAWMASQWAEMGHAVTLITLDSAGTDRYSVDARVTRVGLDQMSESRNKLQGLWRNATRLRVLRRAINKANGDYIVSFTDKMNVLILIACLGLSQRVIVCERIDPRHHNIGGMWSMLRRITYPKCFALVVQTESVKQFFHRIVGSKKIRVIANAVEMPQCTDTEASSKRPWIVAIGRLERQKGFDLLIDAFAAVAREHPEWKLKIVGDGSQREQLSNQVDRLGLSTSVELCGWSESPCSWLEQAAIFVLSSRYEGFPNALLEAMAMGVPPISFSCESGPDEIVRHEVDGLLVPAGDVERLAQAIASLITNPAERTAMGARAREVVDRFGREQFFREWNSIFDCASLDRNSDKKS